MADSNWTGEMRKGLAELCVLKILNQAEAYGFEVMQALDRFPSLSMKESTLYLILARLQKEELVSVQLKPSTRGPKRRYFSLTSAGKERLSNMMAFWMGYQADIMAFLQDPAQET